jgi:hypothetical protein
VFNALLLFGRGIHIRLLREQLNKSIVRCRPRDGENVDYDGGHMSGSVAILKLPGFVGSVEYTGAES